MKFLDLHYHASPDLFQRRHSAIGAGQEWRALNGAAVLKSHLGSTVEQAVAAQEIGLPVYGSLTLNRIGGGVSRKNVLAAAAKYGISAERPLLVYFPTITPHRHRPKKNQQLAHPCLEDIAFDPEAISENGRLKEATLEVLRLGRDLPIRFATGHSTKEEVLALGEAGYKIGLDRLLVTHPAHPCVGFDFSQLKALSKEKIFWFEQTALTFALGYQTEMDFRDVLAELPRVVFSSDFGQPHQPGIRAWFEQYLALMESWRLPASRIQQLFYGNPAAFLGIGAPQ